MSNVSHARHFSSFFKYVNLRLKWIGLVNLSIIFLMQRYMLTRARHQHVLEKLPLRLDKVNLIRITNLFHLLIFFIYLPGLCPSDSLNLKQWRIISLQIWRSERHVKQLLRFLHNLITFMFWHLNAQEHYFLWGFLPCPL